jgi:hypothetical protein
MKVKLTEAQRFYLKQQHNVERDSRVSDQIKGVCHLFCAQLIFY